jgi:hypothetical protein
VSKFPGRAEKITKYKIPDVPFLPFPIEDKKRKLLLSELKTEIEVKTCFSHRFPSGQCTLRDIALGQLYILWLEKETSTFWRDGNVILAAIADREGIILVWLAGMSTSDFPHLVYSRLYRWDSHEGYAAVIYLIRQNGNSEFLLRAASETFEDYDSEGASDGPSVPSHVQLAGGELYLREYLATGGFGSVYRAEDTAGVSYAIKFEWDATSSVLAHEVAIISKLRLYETTMLELPRWSLNAMVMPLFGPSVWDMATQQSDLLGRWDTIRQYLPKMVSKLQAAHKLDVCHGDVKLQHFLHMGHADMTLIDWGSAHEPSIEAHPKWKGTIHYAGLVGTVGDYQALFFSIAHCLGMELPPTSFLTEASVRNQELCQAPLPELCLTLPIPESQRDGLKRCFECVQQQHAPLDPEELHRLVRQLM